MNAELKREIILENMEHPFNKELVNDQRYTKINSNNPNCIDNIDIYVLVEDNIIKDLKFMGEACAISTSSTSIMIKNLIGKSVDDAKKYINNFYNMCNEEEYNKELLNEAIVYEDIYKQNNRKNCALLPYKSIIKAIEEYETK
jgi:nitrogen fixation NifU-like protein